MAQSPTVRLTAGLALCALAVLPRCACEDDLEKLFPEIVVTPESIDLGARGIATQNDATFLIGNAGTAKLEVSAARMEAYDGDSAGFLDVSGGAFTVVSYPSAVAPDDDPQPGTVRFVPVTQGKFAATLVIESDDEQNPEVRVPVFGEGGAPLIEADPEAIDFGVVNEGPGAFRLVLLKNVGYDNLYITDMYIEGARGADGGAATSSFSLSPDTDTTQTLAIDDVTTVEVRMDPVAGLGAMGEPQADALIVVSDAANAPTLRIPLTGEVNRAPVPVAVELQSRQSEVKVGLGREVIFDGSDTTDPEGDAYALTWSLVETPDETAILFRGPPAGNCADDDACDRAGGYACSAQGTCKQTLWTHLIPNKTGTYVIRLRATDEHGAWAETDAKVLPRDFVVLMKWAPIPGSTCTTIDEASCDTLPPEQQICPCNQSDLDLHLMRPPLGGEVGTGLGEYGTCPPGCEQTISVDGGPDQLVNLCAEDSDANVATCRQAGRDCAYANRYPEWGAVGRVDDPRLDVDDVRGEGPEAITINNPADGTYTAAVHYCNDRIGGEPSIATIEIYVKGELVRTVGPQPLDEGEVWYAVEMTRSGGPIDGTWAFTNLPAETAQIGTALCEF